MIVAIPAYQPDEKLIKLIDELRADTDCTVVIVNDGSDESSLPVLKQAEERATVLSHETNMGKGRALKTAFEYIKNNIDYSPDECIMIVDADGHYSPENVECVLEAYEKEPDALILGGRNLVGKIPFRKRFTHAATRLVFTMTTGVRIHDTQTGLRAFAAKRLDEMLAIPGERYEYENNQLLHCTKPNKTTVEVRIDTLDSDENKPSHFHPLRDARNVYQTIFSFMGTSFSSWLVDYSLLLILAEVFANMTEGLGLQFGELLLEPKLLAFIVARTVSSLLNYFLNRKIVFRYATKWSIVKYFINVAVMFVINYLLLTMITSAGVPLAFAQILAQLIVYPLNFISQRKFVFTDKKKNTQ